MWPSAWSRGGAVAEVSSGAVGAITRKVGPLPLWAWAALFLVGFILYRRMRGSGSGSGTSGPAADTSQTTDNTYVPGFDAAGAGGGGGIGTPGTVSTVNNYYYGDQAAVQATGGGTAATGIAPPKSPTGIMQPGGSVTGMPPTGPRRVDPGPVFIPHPPVVAPVSQPPVSVPYRSGTMPFIAS